MNTAIAPTCSSSAKVGSNEYARDIVAFEIAGDSLRPLYNYTIK